MKEHLKVLMEYNLWANEQVWNCVQTLTEAQYTQAQNYSVGTIFDQVFHIMSTDFYTLSMMDGSIDTLSGEDYPRKEDYESRDTLWEKWQAVDRAYLTWLESATERDLEREIGFQETDELKVAGSCAEHIMIIENHSTNHRAQILKLIHEMGGETCEMGLWFYVRERAMKKLETA